MDRKELKEKISEISNSEFPLIDFFNDIDWLDDKRFDTEKAYEDIEKIYNVFVYYKDKVKKIEKELKQTKLNFRNSQTHSKNCYKKLKEKYIEVDYCYKKLSKDHISLKKGFDELFEVYIRKTRELEKLEKENKELKDELKRCQDTIKKWTDNHSKLIIDNGKMKKALDILKVRFEIESIYKDDTFYAIDCANTYYLVNKEEYELLKSVLEEE